MPTGAFPTQESILEAVRQDPSLRFDPTLASRFQELGGALSGGAIPLREERREPLIISTPRAEELVLRAKETMDNLTATAVPPTVRGQDRQETAPTPAPVSQAPIKLEKDGQVFTFDEPSINTQRIQGLIDAGFSITSGSIPDGVRLPTAATDTSRLDELKKLEDERRSFTDRLLALNPEKDLQNQVDSINATFNSLVEQMKEINRRREEQFKTIGIRLGGQFVPGQTESLVSTEAQEGLTRIADLEAKRRAAITDANRAFQKQEWDKYVFLVGEINKTIDRKAEEIKKINEEVKKKSEETEKKVKEAERESLVAGFIAEGITDPVAIFSLTNCRTTSFLRTSSTGDSSHAP